MKLKHKVGGVLRTFSLLLCGAFLLMGVRSCETYDLLQKTTKDHHYEVVTIPWSVRLTVAKPWSDPHPLKWTSDLNPRDAVEPVFGQRPIYRTWYYFGIGVRRDLATRFDPAWGRRTIPYTIYTVPFQTLAFLAFLPITWRILTIRHRRKVREFRRANSQCEACGYDIRASTGRCPECGQALPQPAANQQPAT